MRHGGNNLAFCFAGLVIREATGLRCSAGDGSRMTGQTIVLRIIAAVRIKRPARVAVLGVTLANLIGRLNTVHAV